MVSSKKNKTEDTEKEKGLRGTRGDSKEDFTSDGFAIRILGGEGSQD